MAIYYNFLGQHFRLSVVTSTCASCFFCSAAESTIALTLRPPSLALNARRSKHAWQTLKLRARLSAA